MHQTNQTHQGEDRLLTAEQVAKLFQVSKRALVKWVAAGRVPLPVTVGDTQRWRNSDLQAFIAGLTPGALVTDRVRKTHQNIRPDREILS